MARALSSPSCPWGMPWPPWPLQGYWDGWAHTCL